MSVRNRRMWRPCTAAASWHRSPPGALHSSLAHAGGLVVSVSTLVAASVALPLVELVGVSKRFPNQVDLLDRVSNLMVGRTHRGVVHAVTGIDVAIFESEVVALVGESGCGKSTLGRIVVGLTQPSEGRRLWR